MLPITKMIPNIAYIADFLAISILLSSPAEKKYIIPESTKIIIATIPAVDNRKSKTFIPICLKVGALLITPA